MKRKATKNTRGPNTKEKHYQTWVKESMYCIACCITRPVIFHHCEGSCFRHNKVLVGHWFAIGLCQKCDNIITHRSRKKFRELFGPQSQLWNESIDMYRNSFREEYVDPPFDVVLAITDWGR